MAISRIAAFAAAIVVCTWFGLAIREVRDTNRGGAIIASGRPLTAAQSGRAAAELNAAKVLNPDETIDVLRGRLALRQGHLLAARRILEGVVKREPQNLQAWVWLAAASNGDRQALRLALIRVAQLDPRASTGS